MSLSGKWIDGIRPDGSVCDAARVSLATRLAAVAYWLPLAAEHADQDVEHVHRLRVSTRRAIAALKLYQDWLPPKPYRWLKKRLKKIRRAAGAARDLDVLADRINRQFGVQGQALLDEIAERRAAAQPAIVAIAARCRHKERFARKTRELIAHIQQPHAEVREIEAPVTFRVWAREQLGKKAEAFFAGMPDGQADTATLHQFRIRTKALRYTIELVASAFDQSLRTESYPLVEELQERLGEINDTASATECIRQWSDEIERQQQLRGYSDQETERLDECLREFRAWWTAERAEGLKNTLTATNISAAQP